MTKLVRTQLMPVQKLAAELIVKNVRKVWANHGFTANDFMIAGQIGIAWEETRLTLQDEVSYRNTPAARIRLLFGAVRGMTDAQINAMKMDDRAFFNCVYGFKGNTLGNRPGTDDGYNFRGKGYNQITGKGMYELAGLTGANDIKTPEDAARAQAIFQFNAIRQGQNSGRFRMRMMVGSTSQFTTPHQGAYCAFSANTGWGILPENYPTKTFPLCVQGAEEMYKWLKENPQL